MGLFLQICGVIFLTLIVLLIVGVLAVRAKLRRLIRSLDALSRTVPGTGSTDPTSQADADADAIDVSFTTLDQSTGNRPTP